MSTQEFREYLELLGSRQVHFRLDVSASLIKLMDNSFYGLFGVLLFSLADEGLKESGIQYWNPFRTHPVHEPSWERHNRLNFDRLPCGMGSHLPSHRACPVACSIGLVSVHPGNFRHFPS